MRSLAIILLALCLGGCLTAYHRCNPAKPPEYTVTVMADRGWQNSGIHVRCGQVIQCKAEGQWSDHFSSYGPEGTPDVYKKHFGVNAPANGLIMQISSQTNSYFISTRTNVVADRSGVLRFRKNYSLPIGMEGEVQVRVRVCDDTDGDNLPDYDEINVWHTDPMSADTDGDGFSDLEEVTDLQIRRGEKF